MMGAPADRREGEPRESGGRTTPGDGSTDSGGGGGGGSHSRGVGLPRRGEWGVVVTAGGSPAAHGGWRGAGGGPYRRIGGSG